MPSTLKAPARFRTKHGSDGGEQRPGNPGTGLSSKRRPVRFAGPVFSCPPVMSGLGAGGPELREASTGTISKSARSPQAADPGLERLGAVGLHHLEAARRRRAPSSSRDRRRRRASCGPGAGSARRSAGPRSLKRSMTMNSMWRHPPSRRAAVTPLTSGSISSILLPNGIVDVELACSPRAARRCAPG